MAGTNRKDAGEKKEKRHPSGAVSIWSGQPKTGMPRKASKLTHRRVKEGLP